LTAFEVPEDFLLKRKAAVQLLSEAIGSIETIDAENSNTIQ
jgi:hypothetical protein